MVDSFKYLPRSIAYFYQMNPPTEVSAEAWTPLEKPLSECTVSLVTTGGVFQKGVDEPFDIEREKAEPLWGDPTYRTIPTNVTQDQIDASHLHINTQYVLEDVNCLLPIHRVQTLVESGEVGALAPTAYSFMGFQGMPHDTTEWETTYGPQVVEQLKKEKVDCVLLTPA